MDIRKKTASRQEFNWRRFLINGLHAPPPHMVCWLRSFISLFAPHLSPCRQLLTRQPQTAFRRKQTLTVSQMSQRQSIANWTCPLCIAKARPSYPAEAIAFISSLMAGHQKPPKVLDLGAGTGIMTKLLVEQCGFQVTAVEPVDNMRLKLESVVPQATSVKGTAWSIPVQDASQDMVMLAQCFHWFDDIKSLKEIHRVLKPGGLIILIWNMESRERSEWVAKLREWVDSMGSTKLTC